MDYHTAHKNLRPGTPILVKLSDGKVTSGRCLSDVGVIEWGSRGALLEVALDDDPAGTVIRKFRLESVELTPGSEAVEKA